jgi:hypothetical protein
MTGSRSSYSGIIDLLDIYFGGVVDLLERIRPTHRSRKPQALTLSPKWKKSAPPDGELFFIVYLRDDRNASLDSFLVSRSIST